MTSRRPLPAEGMDGARAGDNLAAMRKTARDEVFLPDLQRYVSLAEDQRMAALDDDHILVEVVHVRGGMGSFVTGPKRHLGPVRSVINVAFNTGSGVIGGRNPVCGRFDEFREIFHNCCLRS